MSGMTRVCVVGAGVIGLSAAASIIETIPNVAVTIIADKFGHETTSDVAGGLLFPYALGDTPMERIKRWTLGSRTEALRQLQSEDGGVSGAMLMPCYMVYNKADPSITDQLQGLENFVFGLRAVTAEETATLFGRSFPMGFNFTSVLWEPRKYMPYLLNRVKARGGVVQMQHLESLDELFGRFDIIVNCSGLGASSLNNDKELTPIRGQIIRMEAPWINYVIVVDSSEFYAIPGTSYATIGGTAQQGNWDLNISKEDGDGIKQRAYSYVPSLKGAKIISDKVGLRPGRTAVRLEKEEIMSRGRLKQVIHNYGHGGAGVTLSWGCAEEVTRLVQECVKSTSKFKSQL